MKRERERDRERERERKNRLVLILTCTSGAKMLFETLFSSSHWQVIVVRVVLTGECNCRCKGSRLLAEDARQLEQGLARGDELKTT